MTHRNPPRLLRALALLAAAVALPGCADLGYYAQSVRGHLQLMGAARPVEDWIARPDTPAALRARLELAQRARAFAVAELGLPDNASYHRYADLGRRAAVWNVVAAPPLSLTLHTWCFPVTGCIGYRGYFDEDGARAEAASLAAQGLETSVYGVPAYSTLGWMNWAGGDPLLNTFVGYPEGDFVRLLFHEMAHQVVYASGDTVFNESFATAVERIGGQRWLDTQASATAREASARAQTRRAAFRALTRETRVRLVHIYEQKTAPALDIPAVAAMKNEAMQTFRERYAALRERWLTEPGMQGGADAAALAGYDTWVARANNAAFGALAAYDDLVPAFEALFAREGSDWPRFYAAVRALARQPRDERHAALDALMAPPPASAVFDAWRHQ
ncbi:aminopeptidase [Ramlibacter sp. H39-3-26]|uniref:aminopeptidase n=1 Tax=Curvibacter soli TaxID=3031331 RepID=UPI0023D9A0F8|nr:aminopeptidase [Ramlibacter sp. H39-3-26]MDF1484947.1 aminopeptidase [Ramlibacter sp. H39-3-26]